MYHKPKPQLPTADNVHFFDNNAFNENVKERTKEIQERVKEQQGGDKVNPEESPQEMPLSFRERLMKSSTILGGIIDNMRSKEEELRSKEEKVRHQNRNLSTKLSY